MAFVHLTHIAAECSSAAFLSWSWSSPVLPNKLGDVFIKLYTMDGVEVDYIRLSVTMNGSQRLLTFHPLTMAQVPLPYRLSNESKSLVAIRQHGVAGPAWELLGAGEACDYVPDASTGPQALDLLACSPYGGLCAESARSATEGDKQVPGGIPLEKLEEIAEFKMRERGSDGQWARLVEFPILSRTGAPKVRIAQHCRAGIADDSHTCLSYLNRQCQVRAPATVIPQDQVLVLSVGCNLRLLDGTYAPGCKDWSLVHADHDPRNLSMTSTRSPCQQRSNC